MVKLKQELSRKSLIREYRNLEIHLLNPLKCPDIMEEIGTIREKEFRQEGGGTGKTLDLDFFDTGETPFWELVVWDPENQEIVSFYRLLPMREALNSPKGLKALPTYRLFDFSKEFIEDVLPETIELGRSVVNRESKKRLQGLFAAWAGLGALAREWGEHGIFFGKVTSYPKNTDKRAMGLLLAYWDFFHKSPYNWVRPRIPVVYSPPAEIDKLKKVRNPKNALPLLHEMLQVYGAIIPPLMHSYSALSDQLYSFGTACNPHFGDVYETAILVPFAKVNPKRQKQFFDSYRKIKDGFFDYHFLRSSK